MFTAIFRGVHQLNNPSQSSPKILQSIDAKLCSNLSEIQLRSDEYWLSNLRHACRSYHQGLRTWESHKSLMTVLQVPSISNQVAAVQPKSWHLQHKTLRSSFPSTMCNQRTQVLHLLTQWDRALTKYLSIIITWCSLRTGSFCSTLMYLIRTKVKPDANKRIIVFYSYFNHQ